MDQDFENERRTNAAAMADDDALRRDIGRVMDGVARHKYTYNFSWLGLPIIQLPADIVVIQELIWSLRPDVVVETGIARGGSLILHASILALLGGDGRVIGVDVDIRDIPRNMLTEHPLFERITLIEGSSIAPETVAAVKDAIGEAQNVLVILDSNHTHEHVLEELRHYASLVRKGGYIIVFDTVIADMPEDTLTDRLWNRARNPKTAVHEFLGETKRFVIDKELENKLLMTNAPDGFLRCVADPFSRADNKR